MAYKPVVGSQMSSPNVIPMADIMLVLLIIFMVVTPMLQKGISVDMAKVNNPEQMPDADKEDALLVSVTRDGKVYFGSEQTTIDNLTNKVEAFDVEMDNSSMELINYFILRRGAKK